MNAPDPIIPGRLPPYSLEAEAALLGILMRDPGSLDVLSAVVAEADFYTRNHRMIWRAAVAQIGAGQPSDAIALAAWLKDRNELEPIGFEALYEFQENAPSPKNVVHYADIVRERAIRRAIMAAAQRMEAIAADQSAGRSARILLDEAQALLAEVDERTQRGRGSFRALGEVFTEVLAEVDAASKANQATGLKTGFHGLDRLMNPMLPGQLIIVGARPAVGKTSLAVNIACHVSTAHSATVAMFSMEMTEAEIATRILAGYSGVAAGKFREHRIGEKEWERINGVLQTYAGAQLHIDPSGGLSIQELTARARLAAKQLGRIDLIVVDYVQLSRSEGRYDNRAVEIGAVTSGLKRLAKELRCPVMALSQLNRDAAKENKRPTIAELRDSGSIESDADTILLLHRPYVMNQKTECEFDAEIILGKQRNGQIGIVPMDYDARFTRFYDHDKAPGREWRPA